MSENIEELVQRIVLFAPKLTVAVLIFFVGTWLAGFAGRATRRTMAGRGVDLELAILFGRLARISTFTLAVVIALQQVEFDLTAFLTGLGIVGFTIGFAIQDVSKNFIAGVLLLLQQPFDIGDAVQVAGQAGVVTEISLRATHLRTFEGLEVFVPNADVYVKPITRYGPHLHRRLQVTATTAGLTSEQARATMLATLLEIEGVVAESPEPVVLLSSRKGDAVKLDAWYWIDFQYTTVGRVREQLPPALQAAVSAGGGTLDALEMPAPYPDVIGGTPGVA